MPDLIPSLMVIDYSHLPNLSDALVNSIHIPMDILAQARSGGQFNQDVLGDIGKGWNSFVQSGQLIAVIIGLVLGYLLRTVTGG